MKRGKFLLIKYGSGLLIVICLLVPFTQCKNAARDESQMGGIINVSPADAKQLIDANQGNANFVILDVRTPAEFNTGYIENALNIDLNAANFESQVNMLDKGKIYLVYCRTGNRSAQAADIMRNLGFRQLYNMLGGISQWVTEGFEIVTPG